MGGWREGGRKKPSSIKWKKRLTLGKRETCGLQFPERLFEFNQGSIQTSIFKYCESQLEFLVNLNKYRT